MSAVDTGPAFPSKRRVVRAGNSTSEFEPVDGMTLRDYFAAKAMQGLCANSGGPYQADAVSGWAIVNCTANQIAAEAYSLSDAMLAARKGGAA